MRIGFVGLGNMGLGMALNIIRAGFDTTVFDVRSEPVQRALDVGARSAPSASQAALDADLVCVAVFDAEQIRDVLLDSDGGPGILSAAREGAVVALHSTISPTLVKELAAAGAAQGVTVVDVAMTGGGEKAATAGTLTFMAGGAAAVIEGVRPVLEAMAQHIIHVGPTGAGVSAKIINNFLATSHVALFREALRLGRGTGLDEDDVLDIINTGGIGSSWVSQNWLGIRSQEEHYTTGKQGMVEMWSKDLNLARELAADHGVSAPLANFMVSDIVPEVGANGLTG